MRKNIKASIKTLISSRYLMFKGRPKSKLVALTFDDGPCAPNTEQILDVLKSEKVKATFFLIGKEIERYPGIVRRIYDEGHEIGIHSYTHADFSKISLKNIREEIEKTRLAIKNAIGFSPAIFRSPAGAINLKLLWYAMFNNIKLVQWSMDVSDSFISSEKVLLTRFDNLLLQRGDIILLHDDSANTVNALPQIISKIKEKGFSFATISSLLK
jgi:peptidoglycan/xylan/chitin deacetylase (PgdA/CDA1 family)